MTTDIRGDSVRVAYPLFQEEGGGSIPTSPLQLNIGEMSLDYAITMNKVWHSRLPHIDVFNVRLSGNVVCFGAEFNGVMFAVAIWSRPVAANRLKDGYNLLELRRMAIANDAPKNTASRMISLMIKAIRRKFPDVIRLISYQDTEVHTGTIYKASGWRVGATTKFISWTAHSQKKKQAKGDQSYAPKIRWEYDL